MRHVRKTLCGDSARGRSRGVRSRQRQDRQGHADPGFRELALAHARAGGCPAERRGGIFLLRPEGSGPYKTIIILGGLYASLGSYSGKAKKYNENGYAVIEVRPTNNKAPTPYKEPAYLGDFVFEQMADLCAVIDSLKYFQDSEPFNLL